jgi:site-specific DNA-methyltransferase (adenine-specific)
MTLDINKIYLGDCLELMTQIQSKSIDMILCDLPYGTTACKWDTIIPFEPLWEQYKRIIKNNGAIVLTASQPFTSALVMSNIKMFKYEWIWDKTFGRQPQLANIQPMKRHENILVFGKGKVVYNPQRVPLDKPYKSSGAGNNAGTKNEHQLGLKKVAKEYTHKTPDSMLIYKPNSNSNIVHPTQKPVALFEYLIKTYTNEGDLVLDNCSGSGTTGVACINTNRNFICIEKDETYFKISEKRINDTPRKIKNEYW